MNGFTRFSVVAVGGLVAAIGLSYLSTQDDPTPEIEATNADSLYNPVRAGEQLPEGYRQSLVRDAIPPIYEPAFVNATKAGWDVDTLVVGLEINGDARAYPVSYLNRREIVNDHVGNTPVLVTW